MDGYRTPAILEGPPRRAPEVHLVRHVAAGVIVVLIGLGTLGAGIALQTRESFECRRPDPRATPTCAIVTHRLIGTTRSPVRPHSYVMSIGEMTLNDDDGTRLYLRIEREHDTLAVYKAEGLEDLKPRFIRYLDSPQLVLEQPLSSVGLVFLPVTLMGLFLVVAGLFQLRPQMRLRWEPSDDELVVETRRWNRRRADIRRFAMKRIERAKLVDDDKSEGRSELVLVVEGRDTTIGGGSSEAVVAAMQQIDDWVARAKKERKAKAKAERS